MVMGCFLPQIQDPMWRSLARTALVYAPNFIYPESQSNASLTLNHICMSGMKKIVKTIDFDA